MRHIETNQLWLQQKVNNGSMIVEKCAGIVNIADAMTKHVNGNSHDMHVERTSMEFRAGRHELAPSVTENVESEGIWEEKEEDADLACVR